MASNVATPEVDPAEDHAEDPKIEPQKTIAAALVAAQRFAKAVSKKAKNKFHDYKYASAEAVMEEARAALNAAGLAVIQERWTIIPPKDGGHHEIAKVFFKTFHADSNETLAGEAEYHIIPERGRPADKALACALTYAESYYLRGLLCLPRVDEEVDKRNDAAHVPPQRQPQKQQQQQKPQQTQQAQKPQQTTQPAQPAQNGQKPPRDKIGEGLSRVRAGGLNECLAAMQSLDRCGDRAKEVSQVASQRAFECLLDWCNRGFKTEEDSGKIDRWKTAADWVFTDEQAEAINQAQDRAVENLRNNFQSLPG